MWPNAKILIFFEALFNHLWILEVKEKKNHEARQEHMWRERNNVNGIWKYFTSWNRTEAPFENERALHETQRFIKQTWQGKLTMTNRFAMHMLSWTNTCAYIHKHMQDADYTL